MGRIVMALGIFTVGLAATVPVQAKGGGGGGRGSFSMGSRCYSRSCSPYYGGYCNRGYGGYCSPGYYGYGNFCYSSRCWNSYYGCYLYCNPWDNCYYYWYAPSSCYYPISYYNSYPPVAAQQYPPVVTQPTVAAAQTVNVVNGSPGVGIAGPVPGPRVAVPPLGAGPQGP